MRKLGQYVSLIKHLGLSWMWFRLRYAARRRLGGVRRASPAVPWSAIPASGLRLGPASTIPPEMIAESAVGEAEAVLRGEFRLFSHRMVKAGFPLDWQRNWLLEDAGRTTDGGEQKTVSGTSAAQVSGLRSQVSSAQKHWSEISDFGGGDIKGVWELSRFPWAFALARAHRRTGDGKYGEAFWSLFADWCAHNPPNQGANWMCGQEATFRLMAVVFAAEQIGVPAAQRDQLARFVATTGRRIAANLDYALSQNNNHGISECIGLLTVALLLPDHAGSPAWLERGWRHLEAQLAELVYSDGGFSQHSLIYHRVLLHDLCWLSSRLERAQQTVPAWLVAAGRRATGFLRSIVDPTTGLAPLYGQNDGANVLPLADAAYLDMRPVLQLASALFAGELPLKPGPWDEAVHWLAAHPDGVKRIAQAQLPARWQAPEAGCAQWVNSEQRLFLRCPVRFRHRPGQADLLHVDLWHRGRPIAMDGGSFSYNSRERFAALSAGAQHNGVVVDGREPLKKFSRFLYLPWPHGEVSQGPANGLTASHDGYAELGVRWTRTVGPRAEGGFVITDAIAGAAGHRLQWHWRLTDAPWTLGANFAEATIDGHRCRLQWTGGGETKARLIRADAASAFGWWSPAYGEVEPACSLGLELGAAGDVALTTIFTAEG